MPEQEIGVGGAKIPGILVESPKGTVSGQYGKDKEKGLDQNQEEAQRMMREAERKRLKRMRYLGDDTREEEGDQEIEEDTVAGDQETIEEVTSEEKDCKIRRKTGKGRRTSSVVREVWLVS